MEITNKIRQRIQAKKAELASAGEPHGLLHISGYLLRGGLRALQARWYLRKCKSLGSMVSVYKKPQISIKGEAHIGEQVRIWSVFSRAKIFVNKGAVLKIGKNSRINGVHLSVNHRVEIGDNVRLAPYTIIVDSDFHKVDDHFSDDGASKAIIIEDEVWVTMNCMIMKGVRIGKGSVVAAGAVVTRDVPPYTIVGGVPAKVIRKIDQA